MIIATAEMTNAAPRNSVIRNRRNFANEYDVDENEDEHEDLDEDKRDRQQHLGQPPTAR